MISADLEHVTARLADGQAGAHVACHRRCWARHQTITDPDHADAAAALRQAHRERPAPPAHDEVAYRDLADYDRLFGLDSDMPGSDVIGEAV